MRKITGVFSGLLLVFTGCQQNNSETKTSLVEKSIEAISGQKIDALDVDNIESNVAEVAITVGDENLQSHFKKGFGSITASKETIAITIAGGENGQDNILIGFTGKDLTSAQPISGKSNPTDGNVFTFSIMKVTDKGMESLLSFESEGEIASLHGDQAIIKVRGKLGYAPDAENPGKWKNYKGTITLNHPVFQALGSSKEDFQY
jgi:hypothetical protein